MPQSLKIKALTAVNLVLGLIFYYCQLTLLNKSVVLDNCYFLIIQSVIIQSISILAYLCEKTAAADKLPQN